MAATLPPRYLPTLTEVVLPATARQELDPVTLTAEVVKTVTPLVEQELRRTAHAQLDAQLNAMLPGLQGKIEEAVRKALQQQLKNK